MDNVTVAVRSVFKFFNSLAAVNDITFEVQRGEVYGLLGPNGAGKTTLIRLLMDILRPDSGQVELMGFPSFLSDKSRIGYLPEERGLYTRQKVLPMLEYFGQLKGLSSKHARKHALQWLERMEMQQARDQKIQELSKGNQQKIQLIATIIANPDVIILDEPFSGLDPMNTRMVINLIRDLSKAGKTILLSTHQMNLVETLCERVFMINRGQQVLYGKLEEIQRQYSENALIVRSGADYGQCHLIARWEADSKAAKVYLREGVVARDFLGWILDSGCDIESFEKLVTPLEDIFVKLVEGQKL
jgi:ABC-2 type transport system ATP-binding protein